MKPFDEWNKVKKIVDIKIENRNIFFHEREIWWVSAGLNIGVEVDGKHELFERPVLIIKKFNGHMFLGIPITSKQKTGPYHIHMMESWNNNVAVISQMKAFSSKRLIRKMGTIPEHIFYEISNSCIAMFPSRPETIEPAIAGGFSEAEATNRNSI